MTQRLQVPSCLDRVYAELSPHNVVSSELGVRALQPLKLFNLKAMHDRIQKRRTMLHELQTGRDQWGLFSEPLEKS
jgi:hypothetical protein